MPHNSTLETSSRLCGGHGRFPHVQALARIFYNAYGSNGGTLHVCRMMHGCCSQYVDIYVVVLCSIRTGRIDKLFALHCVTLVVVVAADGDGLVMALSKCLRFGL